MLVLLLQFAVLQLACALAPTGERQSAKAVAARYEMRIMRSPHEICAYPIWFIPVGQAASPLGGKLTMAIIPRRFMCAARDNA